MQYMQGAVVGAAILGARHCLLSHIATLAETDAIKRLEVQHLGNIFALMRGMQGRQARGDLLPEPVGFVSDRQSGQCRGIARQQPAIGANSGRHAMSGEAAVGQAKGAGDQGIAANTGNAGQRQCFAGIADGHLGKHPIFFQLGQCLGKELAAGDKQQLFGQNQQTKGIPYLAFGIAVGAQALATGGQLAHIAGHLTIEVMLPLRPLKSDHPQSGQGVTVRLGGECDGQGHERILFWQQ